MSRPRSVYYTVKLDTELRHHHSDSMSRGLFRSHTSYSEKTLKQRSEKTHKEKEEAEEEEKEEDEDDEEEESVDGDEEDEAMPNKETTKFKSGWNVLTTTRGEKDNKARTIWGWAWRDGGMLANYPN